MTQPVKFRKRGRSRAFLWALVAIQTACATVFLWDILASVFGLRSTPLSWQLREFLEVSASLGLILGAAFGLRAVVLERSRAERAESALKTASGAFVDVVETQFDNWNLTPAEKDVAWFSLKGFSIEQIADFRGTSQGTIKAQSNAIYRKAGVTGKTQLMSLFVEDLLGAGV